MKILTIDIETTGLNWQSRILSVAVAYRNEAGEIEKQSWPITAYDLYHTSVPIPEVRYQLQKLIEQYDLIAGHNLSFDLSFLYKYNLVDPQWVWGKTMDTLITARMTKAYESVSLYNVAVAYGLADPKWQAMKAKRTDMQKLAVESLLAYNEIDCEKTLLVAEMMLEDALKLYSIASVTREGNFASVVAQMRCTGIGVDYAKLDKLVSEYQAYSRQQLLTHLIPERIEGGNDATQIVKFLQKHEIEAKRFTKGGKISTDEEALVGIMQDICTPYGVSFSLPDENSALEFDFQLIDKLPRTEFHIVKTLLAVVNHRHYEKALNTWLLPLYDHAKEDGLVHALYGAGGTVSYRLNCAEPNLQAFKALDVWQPHVNADYSQAEYRLMGMYAKSKNLAKGYQNGEDAHTATAKILYGKDIISKQERKVAKTFNFAALYGAGIAKLMGSVGMTEQEVTQLQTQFRKRLPEIGQFTREVNTRWKERGYIILWNGTRIWATTFDRENRSFKGANQICQGGVAQLTAEAMLVLHQRGVKLLGQIHDSLQFPLDVDQEEVKQIMENVLDERLCNQTTPPIHMVAEFEYKGYSDEQLKVILQEIGNTVNQNELQPNQTL